MSLQGIAASWGNVGYMGVPICLAAFGDFAGQFAIAAPPEDDQRNVEQERDDEHIVRMAVLPDERAERADHGAGAGACEQDDRCHHDAAHDDIAAGGLCDGIGCGLFPLDDNASWEKNAAILRGLDKIRQRLRLLDKSK